MSSLTSFEKKVILKVLEEAINREVKQNPNRQVVAGLSKGKKGNVISAAKLEELLNTPEGRELIKPIVEEAKKIYGEKPRTSTRDIGAQRNTIRSMLTGKKEVVNRLVEKTTITSQPLTEEEKKATEFLPSIERVEEAQRESPALKMVGKDFLKADESKDTLKVLNTIANIPSNARTAIRQLLRGTLSVEQFLGRANLTRSFIRNVASGLALIYMTPGSFGIREKNAAFDRAILLGSAILAGTGEVLKRSAEDFEKDGRIKEDRLKGKMRAKPLEGKDDPLKDPDPKEAKEIGKRILERLRKSLEEQPENKGELNQAIQRVEAEVADVKSTGVLSDLQKALFKLLKPVRDLPSQAIMVALGSLPIVGEVEVKPEVKAVPEKKALVKVEKPKPKPAPKPEPKPEPLPPPPEEKKEEKKEEEPKEEEKKLPKAPSALIPDIFSKFTPKQIKVDQEKEEQKSFSKAKPDTIIPATKVLEPYSSPEGNKADYQMQVAFDYDIPYTMNGVILEENELMQQVQLENEIRYRDAGLWYGNNDWDIPRNVGFESKGDPNSVPVLAFNESYSDSPINPNNTFEQNIIYNSFTNNMAQDGNDNSLRNSVLFGKQPT